jgi:hypothetical protein
MLMKKHFPFELLKILELWFSVSMTCVKFGAHVSYFFKLLAGVRQGGVLSPLLFGILIDGVVDKIRAANLGCYIATICVCIFLYADDILLLAPSVTGLQTLVNICENELLNLDISLNVNKSLCIRFTGLGLPVPI